MKAERTYFEKLDVYKLAERLSDEIWAAVRGWVALSTTAASFETHAVPCTKHDIG
jgi:hypothetical protein